MAGEQRTYYYVVFPDGHKQVLSNQRVVKVDVFYVSKNHDAPKDHFAAHMTLALAEQIAERYKHRNPIIKSDIDFDFGEDPLKSELWQVGEADAPPPQVSTDVAAFEDAIRTALAQLGRAEVWSIFGRIYS